MYIEIDLPSIHSSILQGCVCRAIFLNKSHGSPPFLGSGLEQFLLRSRYPPPHDLLHKDHGDQGFHPPSMLGGTLHKR